jgi:hypothetical protein
MAIAALDLPLDSISTRGKGREKGEDLGGVDRILLGHNASNRRKAVLREEANGGIRANRLRESEADF